VETRIGSLEFFDGFPTDETTRMVPSAPAVPVFEDLVPIGRIAGSNATPLSLLAECTYSERALFLGRRSDVSRSFERADPYHCRRCHQKRVSSSSSVRQRG